MPFLVQRLVGLGHNIIVLFVRRKVNHFVRNHRVHPVRLVHNPVRGLNKTVLVHPRIGGQGIDQADVGSFRGLNGAHAAIMGIMHVPDFKPGPLPGQAPRP